MNMRDLIPWGRGSSQTPGFFRDEQSNPFLALHRGIDRLFDDALHSFDALYGRLPSWPNVEISETDQEFRVTAEMPGLEEKDVEILLSEGVLTIRGEKQSEVKDEKRQFSECFYGRFERQISLGTEVEEDRVEASFKNGVLTVTLPKTAKAQAKRITINGKK